MENGTAARGGVERLAWSVLRGHPHEARWMATALVLLVAALAWASPRPAAAVGGNRIVRENREAGTDAWKLDPLFTADDLAQQIKGYASAASVNVGQSIR